MHEGLALDPADRLAAKRGTLKRLARGEATATGLMLRAFLRRPRRAAIVAGCAILAGAVLGNLLLFQPEAHRAPMFVGNPLVHDTPRQSDTPLPPQRPERADLDASRKAELLRDIQLELGRRGFLRGEPDPNATAATGRAIRDFQQAAGLPVTGQPSEPLLAAMLTSNVRVKDQILSLLKAGGTDRLERPETVVAVQRALTKIGFGPLKDDGHFGPGTRAALDRFERDRKLTPRGDNPARVLRELQQASGIAID
ncbi:MAG: peptidoglycan-binding domain-containing protein [Beijerinckiaceae bacterium]